MQRFCPHMQDYGELFIRAEAAYRAFNAMVDRAVAEEDTPDLRRALDNALEDWQRETRALREKFRELYEQGRILLPKGALQKHGHGSRHQGHGKCSDCFKPIPRLEYPEWQIAHNGAVNFRGEELDLEQEDLALVH